MIHLAQFDNFDNRQDPKDGATPYDKDLHFLMTSVLMCDLVNWFNYDTYFEALPWDDDIWELIDFNAFNGSTDKFAKDAVTCIEKKLSGIKADATSLIKSIDKINRYNLDPSRFEDISILDLILSTKSYKSWNTKASFLTLKSENISMPNSKENTLTIPFNDLLSNWQVSTRHHFKDTFMDKIGEQIKQKVILFWVRALTKLDKLDINISSQICKSICFMAPLYEDMLNELTELKIKIPPQLAIEALMSEENLSLPIDMLSDEAFTAIASKPKYLSICKNNRPDLYNEVRNKRDKENKWKTDLSADMGDLGFD